MFALVTRKGQEKWVYLKPGSKVYSILLFILTAPRLKVKSRAVYVNLSVPVRRFGHKKVYHALSEIRRRYEVAIFKPTAKQFCRPHVWQLGGLDRVNLSGFDCDQGEWRTWM